MNSDSHERHYITGVLIASVSGAVAVVFGAFGAHYLKELLEPSSLAVWKTAVEYQFYHTIAIFITAIAASGISARNAKIIIRFFLAGVIMFSGSLYLISTASVTGLTWTKVLGPVTPLGGVAFIVGWILLGIKTYRSRNI